MGLTDCVARVMWDTWRKSPVCKPEQRDITWEMILGNLDRPKIKELYDTGMAEASAAISALMKALAEPKDEWINDGAMAYLDSPVEGLQLHYFDKLKRAYLTIIAQFARENVGMEEE